jgi:hypothetical protein
MRLVGFRLAMSKQNKNVDRRDWSFRVQTMVPTALLSSPPNVGPSITVPLLSNQAHFEREPNLTVLDGPTGPLRPASTAKLNNLTLSTLKNSPFVEYFHPKNGGPFV